jgi:hypothetical protein
VLGREGAGELQGGDRLVGEHPQDAELLRGRQQPVGRVVGPDEADRVAGLASKRDDQPVPVPGPRPAAVQLGFVVRPGLEPLVRLLARKQVAALGLEPRIEQAVQRGHRQPDGDLLAAPAARRSRDKAVAFAEEQGDPLEREGAPDSLRDGFEHLLRRQDRAQPRRDLVEVLERGAVPAQLGSPLQLLHGVCRLGGHRAEEVELVVGRAAARVGLVDREHAQQPALGVGERDEQAVLRVPGIRVVGVRSRRDEGRQLDVVPVELAAADEVGAAAAEAIGHQRLPVRPRAGRPEQRVAGVFVPVHGGDLEVVPGRAIEVDDHRLPAEAGGDRRGDRVQQVVELSFDADEVGQLEQRPESCERGRLSDPVVGRRGASGCRMSREHGSRAGRRAPQPEADRRSIARPDRGRIARKGETELGLACDREHDVATAMG